MEKERTKKRTMEYEKPVVVDLGSECGHGNMMCNPGSVPFGGNCQPGAVPNTDE